MPQNLIYPGCDFINERCLFSIKHNRTRNVISTERRSTACGNLTFCIKEAGSLASDYLQVGDYTKQLIGHTARISDKLLSLF